MHCQFLKVTWKSPMRKTMARQTISPRIFSSSGVNGWVPFKTPQSDSLDHNEKPRFCHSSVPGGKLGEAEVEENLSNKNREQPATVRTMIEDWTGRAMSPSASRAYMECRIMEGMHTESWGILKGKRDYRHSEDESAGYNQQAVPGRHWRRSLTKKPTE